MASCLVVGGGGFIGTHLVRLLHAGGRSVIVCGRSAQPRNPLPEGVRYVQADAGDVVTLGSLLEECDEVIDLAYSTIPKTSFEDPVHDVVSSLPPTVALIKLASERKLRRFVLISSGGTVYGNPVNLPLDESHPTNPVSPYGITKLAAEKYCLMYHRLSGLPILIVRPGNPYGPLQMGNLGQGFVGTSVFSALAGKAINIFGERGTVRDYIYVEDLAAGVLAALDHGTPGETYNIGTGVGMDNRSVLDVLSGIATQAGCRLEVINQPPRPFDVSVNVLSSARLTYVSGWRAQTSFEDGLARTWAWAGDVLAGRA